MTSSPPPAGSPTGDRPKRRSHFLAWAVFVTLGSAGAWFAWMGWDQEYWVDPATGMEHGPYEAWQVLGCGLTLIVIAVAASWGRHWTSALLLPPSFTVAWSVTAASEDMTGLWLVGAILVLIGSSVGVAVILGATRGVKRLARPPHRPDGPQD